MRGSHGLPKNFLISSDHQHTGYRSSYLLKWDSHSDKMSFWCIFDFRPQFLFPLDILFIYFQCHSSGADIRGEGEDACSCGTDPHLILSLLMCFNMPSAPLPQLPLNCLWQAMLSPINCFTCNTAFLILHLLTAGRLTSALCKYCLKPTLPLFKNSAKRLRKSFFFCNRNFKANWM